MHPLRQRHRAVWRTNTDQGVCPRAYLVKGIKRDQALCPLLGLDAAIGRYPTDV